MRWSSLFLSAVAAVNHEKVSFQAFEIDSRMTDILWCGKGNDVILAQT